MESEFAGGFGIFTKHGVIKPVFNAFRMISLLTGTKIQATSTDPYLSVLATVSENTYYILFSSYIPENGRDGWVKGVILTHPTYLDAILTISLDYLASLMRESEQFTDQQINDIISAIKNEDENKLIQILSGFDDAHQKTLQNIQSTVSPDIDAFFFMGQDNPKIVASDNLKTIVTEIRNKVPQLQKQYLIRESYPASVNISFSGIQVSGNYIIRTYKVDRDLANSYSVRSKIESALNNGQSAGVINQWPEVQLSAVSGTASAKNGSVQLSLNVSSYSSTLIIIRPQQ